jgi:hypothetical protein
MSMQNLNEGLLSQSFRAATMSNNGVIHGKGRGPLTASTGFDQGNRTTGDSSFCQGVPISERHRVYFGMSNKPTDFRM